MSMQIKNRWTNEVIKTVRAENLSGANLRGANLRSADLSGADLSGANLRSADLSGADLSGADLSGADLSGADLSGADLRSANLRSANLSGADLSGANLSGANLRGANLSGADLSGADLRSANLRGVAEALGIDVDPELPGRILAQIEAHPETWQQDTWHSECGTRHCIAGFATHLSGALGKFLDRQLGTATAATLLLWRPGVEMPSFAPDATDVDTLERLRVMAGQAVGK